MGAPAHEFGRREMIEHKEARVVLSEDAFESLSDEERAVWLRDDRFIDFAENFYHHAMQIVAAGVLRGDGSLEKAASVLRWGGWRVPLNYFEEGDTEVADQDPEAALELWVEREQENIARFVNSKALALAVSGRIAEELDKEVLDQIARASNVRHLKPVEELDEE
jgi:hypothetical protein